MKRLMVLLLVLPLAMGACRKGHPISVKVSPDFQSTEGDEDAALVYEKIAVFPFMSALHHSQDPDDIAPAVMEKFFVDALNTRTDYHFIAPSTVNYAVGQNGWQSRMEKLRSSYPTGDKADPAFLSDLAEALQCDAFLLPVVDTWQKDEVDILENATPATYVGATITIVDGVKKPGKVLFRAVDENYVEGARSETADRTVIRSAGRVRADMGAKSYAAPEFDDVAPQVCGALVSSLPPR